jgi:YD repeat-containing protein
MKTVGAASSLSVGYEYFADGRRKKLIYPDGSFVTYEYTTNSWLKAVKDGGTNTIVSYEYNAAGYRTKRTLANNTSTNTTTYLVNKLNQYTNVSNRTYTYDTKGNLTNDGNQTYTYDYESLFSRVRYCEKNIKRYRSSAMSQRWLAGVLLYSEKGFKTVKGHEGIEQVMKNIEIEQMAI